MNQGDDRSPEVRAVLVGMKDLDLLPSHQTHELKPGKDVVARSAFQLNIFTPARVASSTSFPSE